jgi:hypothetical protein
MLGADNVRKVESDELSGRFRAQLGNVQLVVIEELMHRGRLELYNSLKEWITGERIRAEDKNIRMHDVRTPRFFLAFSNHDTPIYMDDDDRRFFAYASPAKQREPGYYRTLFDEGLKQAGAFKYWLLHRDLSAYSPKERPPMTSAKRAIIGNSKTPLAQELANLLDKGTPPFDKDLVTIEAIQNTLRSIDYGIRPNISEVKRALKELRAINLARQVRMPGVEKSRFWIIKNPELWSTANDDEIRAHVDPNGVALGSRVGSLRLVS